MHANIDYRSGGERPKGCNFLSKIYTRCAESIHAIIVFHSLFTAKWITPLKSGCSHLCSKGLCGFFPSYINGFQNIQYGLIHSSWTSLIWENVKKIWWLETFNANNKDEDTCQKQ